MMVKEFNKEYKRQGGIQMLNEMRALRRPQREIANQFGVSGERVRQWMVEFFGAAYDPRYDRRNAIIESMIDLRKHLGDEEFDRAFRSSEYYERAKNDTRYDSE
jgi:hypothetical protein